MPRVTRVRHPPSVRRAFLDWLAAEGAGHAGRIGIRHCTGRMLMFRFDCGHPFLQGVLRPNGLTVWAQANGVYWDAVLDLDVHPVRRGDAWHCGLCAEPRLSFLSREALWRDHLFDPLAGWMDRKLAPAEALAFFKRGGATWAQLVPEAGNFSGVKPAILVPLPRSG